MAIGEPHEPLERARVGRGGADAGGAPPARGQGRARPAAGSAAPGPPARGWRDTRGRPRIRPAARAGARAAGRPATRRRPAAGTAPSPTTAGHGQANSGAGPGSAMPDCIKVARRSRSAASSAVAGQIGLKLYHCSGAAATVDARASAIAWVARWSSAGSDDVRSIGPGHVTRNVSSGRRRIVIGRMREPVFAARVAGPAGRAVHCAEQPHRDPVRAIAPVDQQAEHLAPPQHPEDRRGCSASR